MTLAATFPPEKHRWHGRIGLGKENAGCFMLVGLREAALCSRLGVLLAHLLIHTTRMHRFLCQIIAFSATIRE